MFRSLAARPVSEGATTKIWNTTTGTESRVHPARSFAARDGAPARPDTDAADDD